MKKIISWLLLIIWLFIIFYLSSQTGNISGSNSGEIIKDVLEFIYNLFNMNTSNIEQIIDIIHNQLREMMHTLEYLVLGLLVINLLKAYNIKNKTIVIAISLAFIYSVSDEIHQIFVKGRAFEYFDIFMDMIGSTLGVLIGNKFIKYKHDID